jgi:hypothetical protein
MYIFSPKSQKGKTNTRPKKPEGMGKWLEQIS